MFEMLKLRDIFQIEIELKDTQFSVSRVNTKVIMEQLRNKIVDFDLLENRLDLLKEKLEELELENASKKLQPLLRMSYCKNELEKEQYKVYLLNGGLYHFRFGKYIEIDSEELFKSVFNDRTPMEDDEYLESMGYHLLPERKGKSCFSCFVIDKNNNLYIHPYRQDTIQHTFITSGEDVLCAGLMFIKDAKICYIDNRSGHYLSTPKYVQILFNFLLINSKENINAYFTKDFTLFRNYFANKPIDIISNKDFGLNFYKYGIKTHEELLEESELRKIINNKYFLVNFTDKSLSE